MNINQNSKKNAGLSFTSLALVAIACRHHLLPLPLPRWPRLRLPGRNNRGRQPPSSSRMCDTPPYPYAPTPLRHDHHRTHLPPSSSHALLPPYGPSAPPHEHPSRLVPYPPLSPNPLPSLCCFSTPYTPPPTHPTVPLADTSHSFTSPTRLTHDLHSRTRRMVVPAHVSCRQLTCAATTMRRGRLCRSCHLDMWTDHGKWERLTCGRKDDGRCDRVNEFWKAV